MMASDNTKKHAARAASVHARLLNRAKRDGKDFSHTLIRYGLERWIYRLSISPIRDRFLLKGALLFDLWFDIPHRSTHDADFLAYGSPGTDAMRDTIRSICRIDADDGMSYDPDTVIIGEIRKGSVYAGLRATLTGFLGRTRCPVQIDIGFGDAVTPGPDEADFPTLLPDLPAPRLKVYPRETAIAEKVDALLKMGMANSRMKDYFDLWTLFSHYTFDPAVLGRAIAATAGRRDTAITVSPIGLSDEFGNDPVKRTQWAAFLKKNLLQAESLDVIVAELREWLSPALENARKELAERAKKTT